MMDDDTIGQYRIFGKAQKHQFGETLSASHLEDNQRFFLFRFPPFKVLNFSEALIVQWNETLSEVVLSGPENGGEAALPRLEIIDNSLVSIHPFREGVWLNAVSPLPIAQALQVFQQVGSELAVIHERGWIHGMLEVDHILLDHTGRAHLISPPLSWLDRIVQEQSREESAMELFAVSSAEEAFLTGVSSVSTDILRLVSLVHHLFAGSDCGELMSDAMHLRGNLREGVPLQLETVLAELSNGSHLDSIRSVKQLVELISSCFSPRTRRRGAVRITLKEEPHRPVDNGSHEEPTEGSQRQQKKTRRYQSQTALFVTFSGRFFTETQARIKGFIGLCMRCVVQRVSWLQFLPLLRLGILSVGICSFFISVSLLLSHASYQVLEPAKSDGRQGNTSSRNFEYADKKRSNALTEVPLPKFFEEYGGDEYGGFIE